MSGIASSVTPGIGVPCSPVKKNLSNPSDKELEKVNLYPAFQYSIIGRYTPGFSDQPNEFGFDAELRFNKYLRNVFVGIGYTSTESYETRLIGCSFVRGVGTVLVISSGDPVEVRTRKNRFRLGYYFLNNSKLNPYLFGGTMNNLTSQNNFKVGSILGIGTVEDKNNELYWNAIIGSGMDFFVTKYLKTRVEGQYYFDREESGFQFSIGLGFWIQ